ncbi:cell division protein FtsI [Tersicoccus solisilvae]|uniref:Beta-lactamase n=1 Tax=Tersicoccus solisilvae TaxID=1882339 RepID=A0ABQ1NNE7_9MICC|nr:penicillin-binding transpeptidase domain-containing protein [Tersicoccus solisilvae]GGC79473.1 cell division protein FtsI [Tersicoccus solisilvae]
MQLTPGRARPRPHHRTRAAAVVAVGLLAATLTACTDSGDPVQPAAERLAAALSARNTDQIAFTGTTGTAVTKQLTTLSDRLGGLAPKVTVEKVDRPDDDAANVAMNVTWDVDASDRDWTYAVTAQLSRTDGHWSVTNGDGLINPSLDPGEQLALRRVAPERGDILGAGNARIVTDRPVVRVGLDKAKVPAAQQDRAARAIAAAVDIDAAGYAATVKAAGAQAFVEAITYRDGTHDAERREAAAVTGAVEVADRIPLAPTSTFARAVLGTVGPVTAEMVAQSGGRYRAGDVAGLSGLQAQYEDRLAGTPGARVLAVPATGDPRVLFENQAQPGTDVRTTLDPTMQTLAEGLLADQEPASALVAVKPSTGEILAAASGPGSKGYDTALLGQYAPGSTFKVATSLGLLRTGATPSTTVPCTPSITVDGRTFRNFPGYPAAALGKVPLSTAITFSCNTAFIAQHDRIDDAALTSAAASLGVGRPNETGAAAFLGSVPTGVGTTDHAASMIGQGKVLVSPLAAATMAASVAHGSTVTPRLITEDPVSSSAAPSTQPTASPSGTSPASPTPTTPAPATPLTAGETAGLRTLMRSVVTGGGVDSLKDVPGGPVYAKTGTAEFGTANPPETHSWIIAYQGDLAVAVFVEKGDHGAVTSAPIAARLFTDLAK